MMRITRLALLFCFLCFVQAQAGIILKIVVVNPSKSEPQKVPVKVYLPKEVKPQDVLSRGDLDIAFDNQQGSYYVYGDYDLKAGEVLDKEIELRDIWQISQAELESLRLEAGALNKMLKDTDMAERIEFLYTSIVKKIDQIIGSQKATAVNPQDHISQYRNNLELLNTVKSDLAIARSMLNKGRPFSSAVIWKIIVFVLVFLTVLSLGFYMFWQRQLKSSAVENLSSYDGKDQKPSSSDKDAG